MKKYAFGVDIGGTACKIGLFDLAGSLLEKWEIKTDTGNNGKNVLEKVAASLQDKMKEKSISIEELQGIGMGLPGTVDRQGYFECPNLNWKHVCASHDLSALMGGVNVQAINDANAAALGEYCYGSGKGYQDMVMVTLGTGVGGGIILGGRMIAGAHNAGGEIGNIVVNPNETEECCSGPKGCLEQYASATGLVQMTKKYLEKEHPETVLDHMEISAKNVFDAYKSGDKAATEIVHQFTDILGKGLSRVSCVVDPEIFVIGGGVSKAGQPLLDLVQKSFLTEIPEACDSTVFALATLGNDAGMYGAVQSVLE